MYFEFLVVFRVLNLEPNSLKSTKYVFYITGERIVRSGVLGFCLELGFILEWWSSEKLRK